ncbi:A24 family peptidase [Variovorax sp. LT1R20]|uniref:A24 family peptidase n=1 Tax=Variovorax sp. LT1R20 TaxID=3443729 RepID=UPI003F47E3F9
MTGVELIWLLPVIVYDFYQRRVPNWLVLTGAALALTTLSLGQQPVGVGWFDALAGAVLGFGFLLLFYAFNLMGAGDVKFAGALGLWVGWQGLVPIWIGATLLAGMHGVLWLVLQRWPWFPRLALALSGPVKESGTHSARSSKRVIPYAAYLAITAGIWIVWGRQR